jgi:subtilisin family serine protease
MTRWADALALAAVGGVLAVVFAGCGGSPDRGRVADGHPPVVPVDLASIPDAVPRDEPFSRYGNPPEYEVFGQPVPNTGLQRRFRRKRPRLVVWHQVPRPPHFQR